MATKKTCVHLVKECAMKNKAIWLACLWLPSRVSEQIQQHHLVQTPENGCSVSIMSKLWIWKRKRMFLYNYELTSHNPSQPRIMKSSLSVNSNAWMSGVAMTPYWNQYLLLDANNHHRIYKSRINVWTSQMVKCQKDYELRTKWEAKWWLTFLNWRSPNALETSRRPCKRPFELTTPPDCETQTKLLTEHVVLDLL